MQAPVTTASLLQRLTTHLNAPEFREVLHPFLWAPVYLEALRITVVQTVHLLNPAMFPQPPEYLELIDTFYDPAQFDEVTDVRSRILRYISVLATEFSTGDRREKVESFVNYIAVYLADYVLLHGRGAIIQRYSQFTEPTNLSLRLKGHILRFDPTIAVSTWDGAPLLTVVTPSRPYGDPNCQLVGYLLAVAQKRFDQNPEMTLYHPYLIRLTDDGRAYFATAEVTRAYLQNVEEGMVNEEEQGFQVHMSVEFNLNEVLGMDNFVGALTGALRNALGNEGFPQHM